MKKKLFLGISIVFISILVVIIGSCLFSSIPNVECFTPKEGFIFFGAFMTICVGWAGIIGGVILIASTIANE